MANFNLTEDTFNTVAVSKDNTVADGYLNTNDTLTAQIGTVAAGVFVFGDDTGIILAGADTDKVTGGGAWTLTVNGNVHGADGSGVSITRGSTTLLSTVNVGVDGDISGGTNGILSAHATNISNKGSIGGVDGSAIKLSVQDHTKAFTITNDKVASIVSVSGGYGIEILGGSAIGRTINNAGLISGATGAILSQGIATNKVTNSGTLDGLVKLGNGNDTLTNSGFAYGNVELGGGDNTATNSKLITGSLSGGSGNDKVTNSGTIGSVEDTLGGTAVDLSSQNNSLTNSGKIIGNVVAAAGIDVVSNTGTIRGSIDLGGGDSNSLTNSKVIEGTVTAAGGHDKVTNSGTIGLAGDNDSGDLALGSGNDTVSNTGTIYGDVDLGGSNNTLTNSKVILGGITAGSGDDKVTNSGTIGEADDIGSGDIDLGGGSDVVSNTGTVYGLIDVGDGNNIVTATKVTMGSITGGIGNDTFTIGGTVDGDVDLGNGVNVLKTSAGTIDGNLLGGTDNDTFTNAATVEGYVSLGSGTLNSFTNSGKVLGDDGVGDGKSVSIASLNAGTSIESPVTSGDRYVFANTGTILGHVSINEGLASIGTKAAQNAGTFTNSGTIGVLETEDDDGRESNVFLSDGADIVNNTGTVTGVFYLGDGKDVFTGGGNNDRVQDGGGADKINLGADKYNAAGNPGDINPGDVYFAVTVGNGVDGIDEIDGGAGLGDVYIAADSSISEGAGDSVFINLDTVTQTESELLDVSEERSIAAQTAYGKDVSGAETPGVTRDVIKNFEWAIGGQSDDLIFGSSAANVLIGDAMVVLDEEAIQEGGNDIIYGLGGNDFIVGGAGDDVLIGGAGKDTLVGGDGADRFVFLARTDSTSSVAGRDIIEDFVQGEDLIDLSGMALGEQVDFEFLAMHAPWEVGADSEIDVRAIWTATSTIIQIDFAETGKPTIAIELVGRFTLDETDFLFSSV